ncbi:MAG: hydrogenase iron-sulfur subunit [bacterium]
MNTEPKITAFCCEHSAHQIIEDLKGDSNSQDLIINKLKVIKLPCSGKLDVLHILKAFENGAEGVIVMACHEDSCQFVSGNIRARKRVGYAQNILAEIGIEKERVEFVTVANVEREKVRQAVVEMGEKIRQEDLVKDIQDAHKEF